MAGRINLSHNNNNNSSGRVWLIRAETFCAGGGFNMLMSLINHRADTRSCYGDVQTLPVADCWFDFIQEKVGFAHFMTLQKKICHSQKRGVAYILNWSTPWCVSNIHFVVVFIQSTN